MDRTFLLGVGAQKTGTTWLHSQLASTPFFDPGFAKEYHVFDLLYVPELRAMKSSLIRKLNSSLANGSFAADGMSKPYFSLKLSFYDSLENYFNYFDYIQLKSISATIVGDFTPSYSMLSANVLSRIKQSFEARDFKVKAVFLMRDPFERIYSQLRMSLRNKMRQPASSPPSGGEAIDSLLEGFYRRIGVEQRTRYDSTITALEAVFSMDDIYYGFYENLFTHAESARIQQFLGIPSFTPAFQSIRNQSPRSTNAPSREMVLKVKRHYECVYSFIEHRFGDSVRGFWEFPEAQDCLEV